MGTASLFTATFTPAIMTQRPVSDGKWKQITEEGDSFLAVTAVSV